MLILQETTLTGWHLVGDTGGRVWSVHRETPPYLSVRHSDVMNDLGSAFYWNAPALYLGNKVTIVFSPRSKYNVIVFSKL